jgi:GNAT superfamily N-acetyltransferase
VAVEYRRIEYNDPRAVAIRAAMDVEMGALYAGVGDDLPHEVQEAIQASFVIHPELMVATLGAFDGDELVGHAALRESGDALEVKRVMVLKDYRGHGISKRIMAELEDIARERRVDRLILQTGNRQAEAIALYERIDYTATGPFGLYPDVPFFLFYEKSV